MIHEICGRAGPLVAGIARKQPTIADDNATTSQILTFPFDRATA
jgi:hypothetical protein